MVGTEEVTTRVTGSSMVLILKVEEIIGATITKEMMAVQGGLTCLASTIRKHQSVQKQSHSQTKIRGR